MRIFFRNNIIKFSKLLSAGRCLNQRYPSYRLADSFQNNKLEVCIASFYIKQ
jgi:hypothetical protein